MRKSIVFVGLLAVMGISCGDDDAGGDAADASTSADADPNAPDADPTPDADPAAPDAMADNTGIACGAAVCTFETQECCISLDGMQMCVDDGQCEAVTLDCDGPEDCEGLGGGDTLCCASGAINEASTQCDRENNCEFQVCHTNDDCTAIEAPECCSGGGFFPVNICRAQCFDVPPMP